MLLSNMQVAIAGKPLARVSELPQRTYRRAVKPYICNLITYLLLALSSSLSAHAGVIYHWVDVVPDPEAGPIDAFIEFGDEFWSLGQTLSIADRYSDPSALEAYFGVEAFHFALPGQPSQNALAPIEITSSTTCADYMGSTHRFCPADLAADTRVTLLNSGDVSTFSFNLLLGTRLSGSIVINNGRSDFRMDSLGSLFTVNRLGSDSGACFRAGLCDGGTGFFELDLASVPVGRVPEPSTWALLFVGLLAIGWKLRRG